MFGLVSPMRSSLLHLRNPCILIGRTLPLLVGGALLALAVKPRQILARRRLDARRLGQTGQKLFIALARVPPHNRAHRRAGLGSGGINANSLALKQCPIGKQAKHPGEYLLMCLHIYQSTSTGNRGMIGCFLIQPNTQETPQAQSVLQPPGDAALRLDALEIPDHQRPEIDPRRQAGTAQLLGVKPGTQLLHKRVESLPVKNLVQTNVERVTWAHSHIRIRHPQILLPLSILACSHRHDLILRMTLVDTAQFLREVTGTYTTACRDPPHPRDRLKSPPGESSSEMFGRRSAEQLAVLHGSFNPKLYAE